jgi:hypothetical protein
MKDGDVYIGRKVGKLKGSPLGNPYRVGVGEHSREEAIRKYEEWLERQLLIVGGPVYRELARLVELYKKDPELRLVCWCKPQKCHGDVVVKAILRMANDEGKSFGMGEST